MIRRGFPSPYLRTVALIAAAMACSMVVPLLGNLRIVIVLWAIAVVIQGAYAGSVMAAIQVTVPNELRGLATALLLLMSNLGGLALGSALIGAASSFLFADDATGVGKAFALVGVIVAGISTLTAYANLRRADRVASR